MGLEACGATIHLMSSPAGTRPFSKEVGTGCPPGWHTTSLLGSGARRPPRGGL